MTEDPRSTEFWTCKKCGKALNPIGHLCIDGPTTNGGFYLEGLKARIVDLEDRLGIGAEHDLSYYGFADYKPGEQCGQCGCWPKGKRKPT